jgi:hypothetical protein
MRGPRQSDTTVYTAGSVGIATLPICLTMAEVAINESMSLVFASFTGQ